MVQIAFDRVSRTFLQFACIVLLQSATKFWNMKGGYGAVLKRIVAIFCYLYDEMMISLLLTVSVSFFSFSQRRLLFQYLYFLYINIRTLLSNSIIWWLTTLPFRLGVSLEDNETWIHGIRKGTHINVMEKHLSRLSNIWLGWPYAFSSLDVLLLALSEHSFQTLCCISTARKASHFLDVNKCVFSSIVLKQSAVWSVYV